MLYKRQTICTGGDKLGGTPRWNPGDRVVLSGVRRGKMMFALGCILRANPLRIPPRSHAGAWDREKREKEVGLSMFPLVPMLLRGNERKSFVISRLGIVPGNERRTAEWEYPRRSGDDFGLSMWRAS